MTRYLGGERITVVAAGRRDKRVGALRPSASQSVLVGPVTEDLASPECRRQVIERVLVDVKDSNLVSITLEHYGKLCAQPATAHDDHVHD